jgi:hypothetical protein
MLQDAQDGEDRSKSDQHDGDGTAQETPPCNRLPTRPLARKAYTQCCALSTP